MTQVIYFYCQGFDHLRSKEKTEAINFWMANVGANSEKGHEIFQKYLDSFSELTDIGEVQGRMSEGMKKFLGLKKGNEDGKDE